MSLGSKEVKNNIILIADTDWDVIGRNELVPTTLDIDMAFERYIVKNFMAKNPDMFSSLVDVRGCCLPPLMVPGYIIDIGYVAMNSTLKLDVPIKNYGYEKAKVKVKKEFAKRKTQKSCFNVEYTRNLEICQCESSYLHIQFSPQKDLFKKRETEVFYSILIEVSFITLI